LDRSNEFDWMVRFLGDRGVEGIEMLDENSYRRSVPLTHGDAILEISDGEGIRIDCSVEDERDRTEAQRRASWMLDLDTDALAVAAALSADSQMKRIVERKPGLKIPGTADPFELAIRAIVGQQVSVSGARTVAGKLVAAYGRPLGLADEHLTRTFPRPEDLAEASLAEVGMPEARKRTIRTLSGAVAGGEISLDRSADREATREALLGIPGIGPWTADYIGMRALGDSDAFLASDLGVRKALEAMGLPAKPGEAMRHSERWRPWRSYAVMYLWRSLDTSSTG
jgi:AraC family transcriptional regulator of adaptative response / DNA-3-methyladenine glycosylase II